MIAFFVFLLCTVVIVLPMALVISETRRDAETHEQKLKALSAWCEEQTRESHRRYAEAFWPPEGLELPVTKDVGRMAEFNDWLASTLYKDMPWPPFVLNPPMKELEFYSQYERAVWLNDKVWIYRWKHGSTF